MPKKIEDFITYLRGNAEFRELMGSAGSMAECLNLAKDHGFDLTSETIRAALQIPLESDDLSDDELGLASSGFSNLDW